VQLFENDKESIVTKIKLKGRKIQNI